MLNTAIWLLIAVFYVTSAAYKYSCATRDAGRELRNSALVLFWVVFAVLGVFSYGFAFPMATVIMIAVLTVLSIVLKKADLDLRSTLFYLNVGLTAAELANFASPKGIAAIGVLIIANIVSLIALLIAIKGINFGRQEIEEADDGASIFKRAYNWFNSIDTKTLFLWIGTLAILVMMILLWRNLVQVHPELAMRNWFK